MSYAGMSQESQLPQKNNNNDNSNNNNNDKKKPQSCTQDRV